VALASIALYLPSLGYPFLYDSSAQILLDEFIHQPRHLADVLTLRVLGMDVLDFNRPVSLLSMMLESILWGINPAGYRLTNLLLHGATAALLFRLLQSLSGRLLPALFASLFFALHPLHSETVVEVGYREDLLATFFLIAGLCVAERFQPAAKTWKSTWLPALGVVGCFFLGVASKESGIAGPAALTAFWLFFRRSLSTKCWLLLLAATWAACGGFLAARFALEPSQSVIFTERPQPIAPNWIDLLLIQTRIWTAEGLRMIWPDNLCVDYSGYSIRNIPQVLAIVGVLAFIGLQGFFGVRHRMIALGSAVFWFSLLPVSNFIPIYRPMADRFLYMPMIGVSLMLTTMLVGLGSLLSPHWRKGVFALIGLGLLIPLALTTLREEAIWRDAVTLWEETARRNPTSSSAWDNLGWAYLKENQPAKAEEAFLKAANLTGGKFHLPLAGLAVAASHLGNHREAVRFLDAAIALDARYAQPDKFEKALIYSPVEIQNFKLIALRSRNL
jgi:hypothetical protein